ncbi:MAG TPA: hypothetical protein VGO59_05010 [Verrucomicrobiae bacterium]|jgi:putative heme-binding domain-containing protein
MKRPNPWRLLWISLLTVALALAAFQITFNIRVRQELNQTPEATITESIRALPGFKVELLHSAATNEGSWISMVRDPQGRFIISPARGPLLRMTVAGGKLRRVERLGLPCTDAMGLLFVSNSLFLDCAGPRGVGLYRASALGESFGPPEFLRPMKFVTYDHGSHQLALGPDGKLYMVAGDSTEVPADISPASPTRNVRDDQLLPRENDPHEMAAQWRPLGGYVLRMDLDGSNCELFAEGGRNTYAIDFNRDGELFGADNDMEWEVGMAWYRPCRITHWVRGGDCGYRQGTGKLPSYDEDTLPPTRDIGLGAPSGIKFAPANCAFPPPWRDALFVQDWAYGRLLAVHLIPRGASYQATVETVLRGKPLPMTSLEFGEDGSLYFITGGREAESGLYRLTYSGDPPPEPAAASDEASAAARRLRRQLESFDGHRDPRALDLAWPSLNSPDRWTRYAARVALEFQDVSSWKDRALSETNTEGGLTALLALARCGGPDTQAGLFDALEKFPFSRLSLEQQLLKLRVTEVSFIRQGRPPEGLAQRVIQTLDPLFPSKAENLNEELCQLLLYLHAPDAVAKSVALLNGAPTEEDQTEYLMRLRDITNGWTPILREQYLRWFQKDRGQLPHRAEVVQSFHDLGLDYEIGPSTELFLEEFRDEFTAAMSARERQAMAAFIPKPAAKAGKMRARKFVKNWRMADLERDLTWLQRRRSRVQGRAVFDYAGCAVCHRFAGRGGFVGPDLAAVASRLTARDILESILEPSKVVPGQYQNMVLTLRDGDVLTGRVVKEDGQRMVFMTDLIQRTTVEIPRDQILTRRPSQVSPMPEGLADSLSENEIWDLIACLMGGR